jgi:poly(A)-specific ribonuclease
MPRDLVEPSDPTSLQKPAILTPAQFRAKKSKQWKDGIARQTGLRWIIEALTNGDISDIPVEWFCPYLASWEERDAIATSFKEVKEKLQNKKHIVVGHNLFTDLGFLYATFFGPLPDTVTGFQQVINRLFPIVIDTKFLHTDGNTNAGTGREPLKEILRLLKKAHLPMILLHRKHNLYDTALSREHEAGYDSWMTAEVFLKLSAQIFQQATGHGLIALPDPENSNSSNEDPQNGDLIDVSTPVNNLHPLSPLWYRQQLQNLAIQLSPKKSM